MVDAPEKIWAASVTENYGEWQTTTDGLPRPTEYTRSDLVAELAAENERLKQAIADANADRDRWYESSFRANSRTEALSRTGAVKVDEARAALRELANTPMNISIEDWDRISNAILSALSSHPRDTNTVDAHETANVRDKPEGQQEPVAWGVICPDCMGSGYSNHADSGQVCFRCSGQGISPAHELSGNTGELIDRMAEAIRGDTTSDDTPWATLSEDRKIGWRGDAERALAVVKEYLTARRPSEQAVTVTEHE